MIISIHKHMSTIYRFEAAYFCGHKKADLCGVGYSVPFCSHVLSDIMDIFQRPQDDLFGAGSPVPCCFAVLRDIFQRTQDDLCGAGSLYLAVSLCQQLVHMLWVGKLKPRVNQSAMPAAAEERVVGMWCVWSQIARFMGSTWDPPGDDRTQVGPMLAPWTLLSGMLCISQSPGSTCWIKE